MLGYHVHVKVMSETINCANCGFLLYWGEAIKDRLYMRFSEEKLLTKYRHVCPHCGDRVDEATVTIRYLE
jgi:ribosomal protein S27AE